MITISCGMDTWDIALATSSVTLSIMFLAYRNLISLPTYNLVADVLLAKPLNDHSHPLLPRGRNHLDWFILIFVNFRCSLTSNMFG